MASVGSPRAFGSDPPTGSGRARGSLHLESGLPTNNPLLCFGTVKNSPGFV